MSLEKTTIQNLVQKLTLKDERAFQKLYNLYADDVYAFSRSIVKSDSLAKEILQEVFLKLWIKAESLDYTLNIKAYLMTIARNDCLNLLKKAANDLQLREEVFNNRDSIYHGPYEKLREKELEILKQNALSQLPEKRKRIFMMSREEGKSYIEISEELGISINTVKVQMNKALSALREYLTRHSDVTALLILVFWNIYN